MFDLVDLSVLAAIWLMLEILGALTAFHALLHARTSSAAIAWSISLVTIPLITLPCYWIFGREKFHGYVQARQAGNEHFKEMIEKLVRQSPEFLAQLSGDSAKYQTLADLCSRAAVGPCDAELLIDGQQTFDSIFSAIDRAREYVLVQFFEVNDDELGRALKDRLLARAKAGIRIYFVYDEVGSIKMTRRYLGELRQAGVEIVPFGTRRGLLNRFQLNFRNHRKIVIVDGRVAFVGGHNVGDMYMGKKKIGPWRDTHVRFEGPIVQSIQVSFMEDWYWATRTFPDVQWRGQAAEEGNMVMIALPSSPSDELETCGLSFLHAISQAKRRLWIASPYFVPDAKIVGALQLAAMRGVDVRILLPGKPDHKLPYLLSFDFINQVEKRGVRFYRYKGAFMHQKVVLVDDDCVSIGTANLDNRSFRLNFELMIAVLDRDFNGLVAAMLRHDMKNSIEVKTGELGRRPLLFKLAVRYAKLFELIL